MLVCVFNKKKQQILGCCLQALKIGLGLSIVPMPVCVRAHVCVCVCVCLDITYQDVVSEHQWLVLGYL